MNRVIWVFFFCSTYSQASVLWAPRVHGHWSWMDELQRPAQASEEEFRTLGLTEFTFDLLMERQKSWALNVELRPDALLREQRWDSRASLVYRDLPKLYFMNSYVLKWFLSQDAELSYGVWNSLVRPLWQSSEAFEHGLLVHLPRSFLGGRVSWGGILEGYGRWQFQLLSLAGRNDRGESLERLEQKVDKAPRTQDPHWGGAVSGALHLYQGWSFTSVLGWDLHSVDSLDEEESVSSSVEEVFSQWDVLTPRWNNLQGVIDLRVAQENFRIDSSTTLQKSLLVGSWWDWRPSYRLHTSVLWGESERWQTDTVSGYQVNLGVRVLLADGLEMDHMLSQESRSQDEYGQRQLIRRMGVQIRWNLDSPSYAPTWLH